MVLAYVAGFAFGSVYYVLTFGPLVVGLPIAIPQVWRGAWRWTAILACIAAVFVFINAALMMLLVGGTTSPLIDSLIRSEAFERSSYLPLAVSALLLIVPVTRRKIVATVVWIGDRCFAVPKPASSDQTEAATKLESND